MIAMNTDIVVYNTFTTSFILASNYEGGGTFNKKGLRKVYLSKR